jgi:hypothetical protein
VNIGSLQVQSRLLVRPVRESGSRGFDVFAGAGGPTVARIRQPRPNPLQRVRPPFEIRGGDSPSEVVALAGGAGPVGAFNVATPDGATLGAIRANHGRWELHQPQAPVMVGVGRGIAGTLRKADAATVSGLGLSLVLPFRIEFSADGQTAFTVQRAAGLRGQYTADIRLPWIDRRLVLAQVLALSRFN